MCWIQNTAPKDPGPILGRIDWFVNVYKVGVRGFSKRTMPCHRCNGNGKIIDPTEVPDVIEGHKLSRRIKCPDCAGSGDADLEKIEELYNEYVAKQSKEIEDYQRRKDLYDDAVQKVRSLGLTKEQLRLIGVTGDWMTRHNGHD